MSGTMDESENKEILNLLSPPEDFLSRKKLLDELRRSASVSDEGVRRFKVSARWYGALIFTFCLTCSAFLTIYVGVPEFTTLLWKKVPEPDVIDQPLWVQTVYKVKNPVIVFLTTTILFILPMWLEYIVNDKVRTHFIRLCNASLFSLYQSESVKLRTTVEDAVIDTVYRAEKFYDAVDVYRQTRTPGAEYRFPPTIGGEEARAPDAFRANYGLPPRAAMRNMVADAMAKDGSVSMTPTPKMLHVAEFPLPGRVADALRNKEWPSYTRAVDSVQIQLARTLELLCCVETAGANSSGRTSPSMRAVSPAPLISSIEAGEDNSSASPLSSNITKLGGRAVVGPVHPWGKPLRDLVEEEFGRRLSGLRVLFLCMHAIAFTAVVVAMAMIIMAPTSGFHPSLAAGTCLLAICTFIVQVMVLERRISDVEVTVIAETLRIMHMLVLSEMRNACIWQWHNTILPMITPHLGPLTPFGDFTAQHYKDALIRSNMKKALLCEDEVPELTRNEVGIMHDEKPGGFLKRQMYRLFPGGGSTKAPVGYELLVNQTDVVGNTIRPEDIEILDT